MIIVCLYRFTQKSVNFSCTFMIILYVCVGGPIQRCNLALNVQSYFISCLDHSP